MTTSTATTEFSARQALLEYFEKNALTSFNNSIELLKKRDFYLHAFNKIEQGIDLNAELPELRLVKKTTAQKNNHLYFVFFIVLCLYGILVSV